jgi:hypothetical protein
LIKAQVILELFLVSNFLEVREHYFNEGSNNGVMVLDPETDYRYYMDNSYSNSYGWAMQMPVNNDW